MFVDVKFNFAYSLWIQLQATGIWIKVASVSRKWQAHRKPYCVWMCVRCTYSVNRCKSLEKRHGKWDELVQYDKCPSVIYQTYGYMLLTLCVHWNFCVVGTTRDFAYICMFGSQKTKLSANNANAHAKFQVEKGLRWEKWSKGKLIHAIESNEGSGKNEHKITKIHVRPEHKGCQ